MPRLSQDWEARAAAEPLLRTYRLHIYIARPRTLVIARLGSFRFPDGHYAYTGSAKRNLTARVRRHLSNDKRLQWHIDYLLAAQGVRVLAVELSAEPECVLNQRYAGEVIVPGFGASDCHARCGSHLKFLDARPER